LGVGAVRGDRCVQTDDGRGESQVGTEGDVDDAIDPSRTGEPQDGFGDVRRTSVDDVASTGVVRCPAFVAGARRRDDRGTGQGRQLHA
jgi:hypothetical protein